MIEQWNMFNFLVLYRWNSQYFCHFPLPPQVKELKDAVSFSLIFLQIDPGGVKQQGNLPVRRLSKYSLDQKWATMANLWSLEFNSLGIFDWCHHTLSLLSQIILLWALRECDAFKWFAPSNQQVHEPIYSTELSISLNSNWPPSVWVSHWGGEMVKEDWIYEHGYF